MMKDTKDTKITFDEMIQALNRSGYLIEKRVANIFGEHEDYRVVSNPVIIDEQTDKSREIDLFAIKSEVIDGKSPKVAAGGYDVVSLDVGYEIICECENNKQPIIFIPSKFNFDAYIQCLKAGGSDLTNRCLEYSKNDYPLEVPSEYATQYCSFLKPKGNGKDWIAHHPNEQHDTFSKLVKAVKHKIKETNKDNKKNNFKFNRLHVYYCLVVLRGDMYIMKELEDSSIDLNPINNIKFMTPDMNRETGSYDGYFIDVIEENYLPEYIRKISKEGDFVMETIKKFKGDYLTSFAKKMYRH